MPVSCAPVGHVGLFLFNLGLKTFGPLGQETSIADFIALVKTVRLLFFQSRGMSVPSVFLPLFPHPAISASGGSSEGRNFPPGGSFDGGNACKIRGSMVWHGHC